MNKEYLVFLIIILIMIVSAQTPPELPACNFNSTSQPSCDCVEIEGNQYNSSEVIKIIEYWKSQAENPNNESCRFIINTLNATIQHKNKNIKILIGVIIILLIPIVYLINKLRKKY